MNSERLRLAWTIIWPHTLLPDNHSLTCSLRSLVNPHSADRGNISSSNFISFPYKTFWLPLPAQSGWKWIFIPLPIGLWSEIFMRMNSYSCGPSFYAFVVKSRGRKCTLTIWSGSGKNVEPRWFFPLPLCCFWQMQEMALYFLTVLSLILCHILL